MSSRNKLWIALGVAVFALLAWKLGMDWARAMRAEKGEVAVTGFRSARFGDTEDRVRAAIAKDFPGADIHAVESPVERTKLLVIRVKNVLPDSGNAEAIYVLGYKSKALIQVNVFWGSRLTPGLTPQQLGITATVLQQYFASQDFVSSSVVKNEKLPSGAILVFAGKDDAGHLVRLLYQVADVPAKPTPDTGGSGKDAAAKPATPPEKVAALRLSYIKDPVNPDVFKVEKGAF